jgi:hypothetical protein
VICTVSTLAERLERATMIELAARRFASDEIPHGGQTAS